MEKTKFEYDPDDEIMEYSFLPLMGEEPVEGVKDYKIGELEEHHKKTKVDLAPVIKVERDQARGNLFKISPVVRRFRGIKELEEQEYQTDVSTEVKRRIEEIYKQSFEEGFEAGRKEGLKNIHDEMHEDAKEKIIYLQNSIDDIISTKEKVIKKQKAEIYELIKTLTKWIVLRELNNDGSYIERLLEKLILELQTQDNLLIKVNRGKYKEMPTILSMIEEKIGELKNVRVEIIEGEGETGLILESVNGILDAKVDSQFTNLDKLFESVDIFDEELKLNQINSSNEPEEILSIDEKEDDDDSETGS